MPQTKIANAQYPQVFASVRVWDLPSRLWHWALFGFLAFSVYSGLTGSIALMDWHLRSGYAVLVLLLFRVAWGIWGGSYVRYRIYWQCLRQLGPEPESHTRPGVLMLLALLLLLGIQVATGLFATDDLFTEGPFNNYVSEETASTLSWLHRRNFWLVLVLAGLHVSAVGFYGLWRKDSLAMAMFHGRKELADSREGSEHYLLRALFTLAGASLIVWWLLTWF